jgi:hypothetical protein
MIDPELVKTSSGFLFLYFMHPFLAIRTPLPIFATLSEKSKDGEVDERLKSVVC